MPYGNFVVVPFSCCPKSKGAHYGGFVFQAQTTIVLLHPGNFLCLYFHETAHGRGAETTVDEALATAAPAPTREIKSP